MTSPPKQRTACLRARAARYSTYSLNGEQLLGLFNFSNEEKTAHTLRSSGVWQDLLTGEDRVITGMTIPAQGFCWLKRRA